MVIFIIIHSVETSPKIGIIPKFIICPEISLKGIELSANQVVLTRDVKTADKLRRDTTSCLIMSIKDVKGLEVSFRK